MPAIETQYVTFISKGEKRIDLVITLIRIEVFWGWFFPCPVDDSCYIKLLEQQNVV